MNRSAASGRRQYGLDAMRALVVVGLVFFHASLVFDTRDDYYVKNATTADLSPFAALGVVWAMPLLFVTAGLGTWHSLARRSPGQYARERLRRLLVPLAFGLLVLIPLPVWFRLRADPAYRESFWALYPRFWHVRPDWSDVPFVVEGAAPDRLFETGHLWFVVLLLTNSFLLLPVFLWVRAPSSQSWREALAARLERRPVAVLTPALAFAVIGAGLPMEEGFAAWNRVAYLAFFGLGFLLASDAGFLPAARRARWLAAGLGGPAFAVALGLLSAHAEAGGDPFVDRAAVAIVGRASFGAAGWLWVLAIVGLTIRPPGEASESTRPAATSGRRSAAAGYLGEAVLPFYLLHQTVLVAIAFQVVRWQAPAAVKYATICLGTLAATLAVYDLAIRRWAPTRFLFGMRPRADPA